MCPTRYQDKASQNSVVISAGIYKQSDETEDRAQKHTDVHGNWIYSRTDVKDLQGKGWTITNDTDTTGYPYRKRLIPSSCPT